MRVGELVGRGAPPVVTARVVVHARPGGTLAVDGRARHAPEVRAPGRRPRRPGPRAPQAAQSGHARQAARPGRTRRRRRSVVFGPLRRRLQRKYPLRSDFISTDGDEGKTQFAHFSLQKLKGDAVDPTCINIGRLERT